MAGPNLDTQGLSITYIRVLRKEALRSSKFCFDPQRPCRREKCRPLPFASVNAYITQNTDDPIILKIILLALNVLVVCSLFTFLWALSCSSTSHLFRQRETLRMTFLLKYISYHWFIRAFFAPHSIHCTICIIFSQEAPPPWKERVVSRTGIRATE